MLVKGGESCHQWNFYFKVNAARILKNLVIGTYVVDYFKKKVYLDGKTQSKNDFDVFNCCGVVKETTGTTNKVKRLTSNTSIIF
jgi:hypothetical protein